MRCADRLLTLLTRLTFARRKNKLSEMKTTRTRKTMKMEMTERFVKSTRQVGI